MDLIEAHGSTALGARLLLGLARAGAEVMVGHTRVTVPVAWGRRISPPR
jgi:hypothetical protein